MSEKIHSPQKIRSLLANLPRYNMLPNWEYIEEIGTQLGFAQQQLEQVTALKDQAEFKLTQMMIAQENERANMKPLQDAFLVYRALIEKLNRIADDPANKADAAFADEILTQIGKREVKAPVATQAPLPSGNLPIPFPQPVQPMTYATPLAFQTDHPVP